MQTKRMLIFVPALLVLASPFAMVASAADWPQFRGPGTLGHTEEKELPTEWDAEKSINIAWKAPLPKGDNGFSSPIVFGGKVFLISAVNRPLTQTVLCFSAADGKPLWQTDVEPGPWKLSDFRAGYAAPTPAADAKNVFVLFGSAVLVCLDHDGKLLWRKEMKNTQFDVGIGTSPVLFGDTLILQLDQTGKKSTLTALDKATGEVKWETPRPESVFSHATPILVNVNGKPELVLSSSATLDGFDAATGKRLWSIESAGETPSPAFGDGLVYVDSGRWGGGVCADITGEQPLIKWKLAKSEMGEGLGSPLFVDGYLYKMHHHDTLLCRKAATGEVVFSEPLKQFSTWPSPIATADGFIYFASAGVSYVIKPGPKLEVVASSDLKDASNGPSPAIADGRIFLRGTKFLWCIGKK